MQIVPFPCKNLYSAACTRDLPIFRGRRSGEVIFVLQVVLAEAGWAEEQHEKDKEAQAGKIAALQKDCRLAQNEVLAAQVQR